MKLGCIVVLYQTPKKEVVRLKKELRMLNVNKNNIYFIDNTNTNRGYAAGVNAGLRKAIKDRCDLFLIANPDISLKSLSKKDIFKAALHFDIWGVAMEQDNTIYYGGNFDRWRMSADLISKKPRSRFSSCAFVTGSLMIIKKNVVQDIGFFDEGYGMYYEDADFCRRASQAGYRVGVDCELQYTHFEWSKKNLQKKDYLKRNRTKFLWKYGSIAQKLYEVIRLPKTLIEDSPFLINFFSFNVLSFIIKGLNFIFFLFLIRFLSTEDYGIYTLVWAYIGLFGSLADMGTTTYGIVNPHNKKILYIHNLFSLRVVLSLIALFLSLLLLPLFRHTSEIALFVFLISPVYLANMVSGTLLIVFSLKEKVYKSSLISLYFNIVFSMCLILVTLIFKKLTPIFIGIAVVYIGYICVNLYYLSQEIGSIRFSYNRHKWISIIRQSIIYVFISFFAGLYFMSDVFLLNFYKGAGAVGIYSAGYKFFQACLFIVAGYNFAAMPTLTRAFENNRQDFLKKIKKDTILLLGVGLSIALLFHFFAPYLLPAILKGSYQASIQVIRIVIFALPLMLISSVFLNSLYIAKKPYIVLAIFFFQFCLNVLLNFLFIPHFSYIASAYITVFSEGVNVALAFLSLRFIIKTQSAKNATIE